MRTTPPETQTDSMIRTASATAEAGAPRASRASAFARRAALLLALFALVAALVGCLPDKIAWSPDGRTVYYIRSADHGLYAWDIGTKRSRELFADAGAPVKFCFNSGAGAVFFATERPASENLPQPPRDLNLFVGDRVIRDVVKNAIVEAGMAASADGKIAFCARDVDDSPMEELMKIDLSGAEPVAKVILKHEELFGYFSSSADGKKLLLTFEADIRVLNVDDGTSVRLIVGTKELPPLYGVWAMNETAVAYVECRPKKEKPDEGSSLGKLAVFTLADKKTRVFGSGVPILTRPRISADGKTAYVTQAQVDTTDVVEMDQVPMSKIQIAAYNLETGERTVLTSEPNGAQWPAPDPTGKRLAYFTARLGTRGDCENGECVLKVCELGDKDDAKPTLNCETP